VIRVNNLDIIFKLCGQLPDGSAVTMFQECRPGRTGSTPTVLLKHGLGPQPRGDGRQPWAVCASGWTLCTPKSRAPSDGGQCLSLTENITPSTVTFPSSPNFHGEGLCSLGVFTSARPCYILLVKKFGTAHYTRGCLFSSPCGSSPPTSNPSPAFDLLRDVTCLFLSQIRWGTNPWLARDMKRRGGRFWAGVSLRETPRHTGLGAASSRVARALLYRETVPGRPVMGCLAVLPLAQFGWRCWPT
jgi:hypothetical protein